MDVKQILDAVNGPTEEGKTKAFFGLFHEMWGEDGSVEEVAQLHINKPIVNISRMSGENNDIYYCFEFIYRSHRDEDYKQMWHFLDRFATDSLNVKEEDDKVPGLTLSVFPEAFRGEYFILASIPLVDMIEKTETAGVKVASIRMYFEEEDVQFLQSDEDTFDMNAIQEEVLKESLEEEAEGAENAH